MGFDRDICTFAQQHRDDLLRAIIAKQLPQFLFVKGDAVFLHERDEILWCKARERRLRKIGIVRKKVLWLCVQVGEVAAPAATNQNLFADFFRAFDDDNFAPTLGRHSGAE